MHATGGSKGGNPEGMLSSYDQELLTKGPAALEEQEAPHYRAPQVIYIYIYIYMMKKVWLKAWAHGGVTAHIHWVHNAVGVGVGVGVGVERQRGRVSESVRACTSWSAILSQLPAAQPAYIHTYIHTI